MRKSRLIITALAVSAAMSLPVYAEPETTLQAETTQEAKETKPAETTKAAETTAAQQAEEETTATEETEAPTAEQAETAEPAPEETTAEAVPVAGRIQAADSAVWVMTGYGFEDGSMDIWLSGGGLCIKDDTVVAPLSSAYFVSSEDKNYQKIVKAKKDLYEAYKIDISDFSTVMQSLDTYVCTLNGTTVKGKVIYTDSSIAIIKTETKLDADAYEVKSAELTESATLICMADTDTEAIDGAVSAGEKASPAEPGYADISIDISNKAVLSDIDNNIQGGIIVNEEGLVTGIISCTEDKNAVITVQDINTAVHRAENKNKENNEGNVSDTETAEKIKTLETALKTAEELKLTDYTEETANAMKTAIDGAKAVLKKMFPSAEEMENAGKALEEATAGLVKDENPKEEQKEEGGVNSGKLIMLLIGVLGIVGALGFAVWYLCLRKPQTDDDEEDGEKKPAEPKKTKAAGSKKSKEKKEVKKEDKPAKKSKKEPEYDTDEGYGGEYARKLEEEHKSEDVTEPEREVLDSRKEEEVSDETTVLKRETKAYLIDANGERIEITKKESLLGRQKSAVDIHINNETVGRKHCIIRMENGRYTVEDLDSLNKTKINGKTLTPKTKTPITNGDKLVLSDSEFIFYTGE